MKRLFLLVIALMFLLATPLAVSAFSTTHLNDEPKKKDKKDKDDSASKKDDDADDEEADDEGS